MKFESKADRDREIRAIERFVSKFKGSYKKLSPTDVDFMVYDSDGKLIAFAEVKGRYTSMKGAYPLPIAARKVVKVSDKRLNPVIIWACDDGIIYGSPTNLIGETKWGGRKPRQSAINDAEVMMYYPKQRSLKYMRYNQ